MRRLLKNVALAVSSFMIISLLSGCGKSDISYNNDDSQNEVTEAEKITEEVQGTETEENDIEDSSFEHMGDVVVNMLLDETSEFPDVYDYCNRPYIFACEDSFFTNDGNYRIYTNSQDFLYLVQDSAERYPGVKKALDDFNSKIDNNGVTIDGEVLDGAIEESMNYRTQSIHYTGYYDKGNSYISRLDDKILSIEYISECFRGGNKKICSISGYVYDVETGEAIDLLDVVSSIEELKIAASQEFNKYNKEIVLNDPASIDKLEQSFNDESAIEWSMGPTALKLYYNQHKLTDSTDEVQLISIGYLDYPELFNKGYGILEGDWIQHFSKAIGSANYEDITGDGVADYISTEMLYDTDTPYEYANSTGIIISTDTDSKTFDFFCYGSEVYLVKKNNRYFIYVVLGVGDVGDSIRIYEVTNGQIVESGNVNYIMTPPFGFSDNGENNYTKNSQLLYNGDFFYVSYLSYIVGLVNSYAICNINEDGIPVPKYGCYKFMFDLNLTSKIDLELSQVDENGSVIGQVTVPANSSYYLYSTDDSSYADFRLDDGRYVRVIIEDSKVNGISIFDVFDGLS